jgi:hypothetical protein
MTPGPIILNNRQEGNPCNGPHPKYSQKKKFKKSPSMSWVMITVFRACKGVILVDVLPKGKKINS